MQSTYFKTRRLFNFSPHHFEIGPPIIKSSFINNHLFRKIYKLSEQEYGPFYQFHLNYCLENHPNEEENFLSYIWEIVENRIEHYKRQDPFTSLYRTGKRDSDT